MGLDLCELEHDHTAIKNYRIKKKINTEVTRENISLLEKVVNQLI